MPTITDWLMVAITVIYVVATIIISCANIKSARAAQEQLKQMKNQFEINDSPSVEVEFHHFDEIFVGIRLVNHGKHTAQCVKVRFSDEFYNSIAQIEKGFMKSFIHNVKDKECVLGVQQYTDLYIGDFSDLKQIEDKPLIRGVVTYSFRNKRFETEFSFDLDNYLSVFHVTCHEDEIEQVLDNVSRQIKLSNRYQTETVLNI